MQSLTFFNDFNVLSFTNAPWHLKGVHVWGNEYKGVRPLPFGPEIYPVSVPKGPKEAILLSGPCFKKF